MSAEHEVIKAAAILDAMMLALQLREALDEIPNGSNIGRELHAHVAEVLGVLSDHIWELKGNNQKVMRMLDQLHIGVSMLDSMSRGAQHVD